MPQKNEFQIEIDTRKFIEQLSIVYLFRVRE